jgi:hypothetical protein
MTERKNIKTERKNINKSLRKKEKLVKLQDDVLDYLMKQPNIMPRLNDRILGKESAVYIDLNGDAVRSLKVLKNYNMHTKYTVVSQHAEDSNGVIYIGYSGKS